MWIKTNEGDLLNLNRCSRIYKYNWSNNRDFSIEYLMNDDTDSFSENFANEQERNKRFDEIMELLGLDKQG